MGLYVVKADGGSVSELASFEDRIEDHAWSPDEASIVLVTWDGHSRSVHRVSADGSGSPVLVSHAVDCWKPLWAQ